MKTKQIAMWKSWVVLSVLTAIFPLTTRAELVIVENWWTGSAGTTNWSDAANWHAGVP